MKTTSRKILALIFAAVMLLSCMRSMVSCTDEPQAVRVVPGANGLTPFIGPNGTWCIGDTDTGVPAIAQNGKDGKDGKDGATGANGRDGRWVTSFVINDDGEIVVNYSDGATQNLGKFVPEDGKDAIAPIIRIEGGTWQYSYDNGATWTDTGVRAEAADGKDGVDGLGIVKAEIVNNCLIVTLSDGSVNNLGNVRGENGTNGIDGVSAPIPTLRINDGQWQVSYDGENWTDLGCSAQGEDGRSPFVKIEGGTWWYSYDGNSWTDTSVNATGADGKDGRGIAKMEVINGYLYVTYTDSETPVNVGKVSDTTSGGVVNPAPTDNSTVLAFYPIGDGSEYGVAVGNAKYMSAVAIPATHNGKSVTTIVEEAFYNNEYIETVVIPDGVIKIGANAFARCAKLESVVIPASVTEIGDSAFLEVSTVYLSVSEAEANARGWTLDNLGCFEIVYVS